MLLRGMPTEAQPTLWKSTQPMLAKSSYVCHGVGNYLRQFSCFSLRAIHTLWQSPYPSLPAVITLAQGLHA